MIGLASGIEFCLRGDLEVEEFEGAGLGGRWPGENCCGVRVAEADAVTGQVGEVLQEGAEAVDGLAVFGALARGLAARRGRSFRKAARNGARRRESAAAVPREIHGAAMASQWWVFVFGIKRLG